METAGLPAATLHDERSRQPFTSEFSRRQLVRYFPLSFCSFRCSLRSADAGRADSMLGMLPEAWEPCFGSRQALAPGKLGPVLVLSWKRIQATHGQ